MLEIYFGTMPRFRITIEENIHFRQKAEQIVYERYKIKSAG